MLREKFERQIPAVVLTGDISTQTLRAIAGLGCTHLDKPVEAAELLRTVAHLLATATPQKLGTHCESRLSARSSWSTTTLVCAKRLARRSKRKTGSSRPMRAAKPFSPP